MELGDNFFSPTELTIPANTDVTITLTNTGNLEHTFTIDDLEIDETLQPGDTREVTINAEAGEYEYYSSVPGQREAGMVGTLTVE